MWSRFAAAASRAARACATAAASSSADSSATTSPARTWSPLPTLMLVSCPPTSGATRISVTRTTPTMGAATSERDARYPPAPAATRTRPTAMITGLLAMRPPPLHKERGHHREREIDDRQNPQAPPVARHLPQACAQLVDAHESVDREIRRKDIAEGPHRLGDRFARPGEAGQEQLRQAGGEEDQRRGLRMLE